MASGNVEIRPATALPAPPDVDGTRRWPWVPDDSRGAEPAPRTASTEPAARVWLRRLWGPRGLIGGVLAILIAWLGHSALVTQHGFVTSTRNFLIAIAILILSLLHQGRIRLPWKRPPGAQ